MADLSKYSKADLIWIINRMVANSLSKELLRRAINDLKYEKERKRFDEADKVGKIANKKRQEYIDLLSPYDGMRVLDIPIDVLEKADQLMKEAQAADRKWTKLMGLS